MIPIKDDNPTLRFPIITVGLITVTIISFLYQLSLGEGEEAYIYRMGAIPYEIVRFKNLVPERIVPVPFTLFTSMFMHANLAHIGGNMLFLWVFGNNVEDTLGRFRFLLFYLTTGVAAAATHILTSVNSQVPMIGASGAIAGVLGGYALLFPRARILTLFFFFLVPRLVRVPAIFFLGIWFLFQLLSSGSGGDVAWYAHIGGFVAGLVLVKLFMGGRRRYLWVEN